MSSQSPTPAQRLAEYLSQLIDDPRVLAAVASIPREHFVAPEQRERAYDNAPLEIGCGQTISQPLVVARMAQLLTLSPTDRVLDIGTGSGYHAAILARLAGHVWSVERHAELSDQAAENLRAVGIDNVTLAVGDGSRGLPDEAPFDAINVGAAAWREVPAALEEQLGPGGRLVAPVDRGLGGEHLVLVRRGEGGDLTRRRLESVRFVPLVDE